jgi:hypothetical protein
MPQRQCGNNGGEGVARLPRAAHRGAVKSWVAPFVLVFALTACHRGAAPVERISLDEARGGPEAPISAPDTKDAAWTVSADGKRIDFALPGGKPLLTLECRMGGAVPVVRIERHVRSRPGESALFPVLGSGPNARFLLAAAEEGGEWLWRGDVPVTDSQLDVFKAGKLEATLPGGGSLLIAASPMPGELVDRCREGVPMPSPSATGEEPAESEEG